MEFEQAKLLAELIDQQNASAADALLSLFDLLNQHLQAHQYNVTPSVIFNQSLQDFCRKQAEQLNAHHPEMLAEHIMLIARNAFEHQLKEPDSQSLLHAKQAARALISAQTQAETPSKNDWVPSKINVLFAAVATICMVGVIFWSPFSAKKTNHFADNKPALVTAKQERTPSDAVTAYEAAAMYSKFEMMRKGTCRYLEAIQIPDQDKVVYLENVVGGKVPTNLGDLAKANAYLEKIHCNYTPMLMKTSK